MIEKAFFLYFAFAAVAVSIITVTRRNVMHAVLCMLLLFFHLAGLYLLLNAEFLAAVQIIIYAGAIMVLFLFVIMLLNLREDVKKVQYGRLWFVGVIVVCGILLAMAGAYVFMVPGQRSDWTIGRIVAETHTAAIGQVLYTRYMFPFEVVSLILLVAVIGAIVLAKRQLK
ncbi:MAG: NADH-quinone oxidoreductase subunit J [Nitrospirae bacterium]|nr:NADH-quinone oxidoreductase subunit J [Nitrospirota bacterium]